MTTPKDYCTIEDVKASMNLTGTQDDDALQAAVSAASRLIDHHCERYFYQDDTATARVFVAESILAVEVDDFDVNQTIVVKTDPVGLRTWDQTWTSDDYQMEPLNLLKYGMPWPCNRLRAIRSLYFPVWGGAAISRAQRGASSADHGQVGLGPSARRHFPSRSDPSRSHVPSNQSPARRHVIW